VGVGINTLHNKACPSLAVQVVWLVVALFALSSSFMKRAKISGSE